MNLVRCIRFLPIITAALMTATAALGQAETRAVSDYRVLPGDRLEISVWGEENLLRRVLVRPDGAFSFPLCGDISARNKTVSELQIEVTRQLSEFFADPVVTISVEEVLGNKIYVIGQVNRPGEFIVNPNVDVLQALSMAGGTTAFASANDIRILRRTGGSLETYRFNFAEISKGRSLDQNIMLLSGDVVIVP